MTAHEAAAHLADRPPTFGNETDNIALITISLHTEAIAVLKRRCGNAELLAKLLPQLEQMDVRALKTFIRHPRSAPRGLKHGR